MTGRMSMEQAKAIKEKRALAQELGRFFLAVISCCVFDAFRPALLEEVQAFAKAMEAQDPEESRKSDKMVEKSGSEEEKADSDALPKKRSVCARLIT